MLHTCFVFSVIDIWVAHRLCVCRTVLMPSDRPECSVAYLCSPEPKKSGVPVSVTLIEPVKTVKSPLSPSTAAAMRRAVTLEPMARWSPPGTVS